MILSDSITTIENLAFCDCYALTSLTIPKSVLKICDSAFDCCQGLESISVNSENVKFDSRDNCNAIIETYTNRLILGCKTTVIPQNVTTIGRGAFAGCSDLKLLPIPNSVTTIENGAFWKCTGLKTFRIGNNVDYIGQYAFSECEALKSVIIPNSVDTIESWAFQKCNNLQDVYCYAEAVPSAKFDTFEETPIESATLHVPAASIEAYRTTVPWSGFGKIVALTDDDPKPTNVSHLTAEDNNRPIESYTINGRRLSKPKRGLNLIRMSNGTTKKVIVR